MEKFEIMYFLDTSYIQYENISFTNCLKCILCNFFHRLAIVSDLRTVPLSGQSSNIWLMVHFTENFFLSLISSHTGM